MKTFAIALTFIWVGLVLGISFIETPLKFTAPNITRELGLGIGQVIFSALNKAENLLALLLAISFIKLKPHKSILWAYSIPIIILLVQSLWLLPLLSGRIDLMLSGQTVEETSHHTVYIIIEIIKLIGLIAGGWMLSKAYK